MAYHVFPSSVAAPIRGDNRHSRGYCTRSQLSTAIRTVVVDKMSVAAAAVMHNIPRPTLQKKVAAVREEHRLKAQVEAVSHDSLTAVILDLKGVMPMPMSMLTDGHRVRTITTPRDPPPHRTMLQCVPDKQELSSPKKIQEADRSMTIVHMDHNYEDNMGVAEEREVTTESDDRPSTSGSSVSMIRDRLDDMSSRIKYLRQRKSLLEQDNVVYLSPDEFRSKTELLNSGLARSQHIPLRSINRIAVRNPSGGLVTEYILDEGSSASPEKMMHLTPAAEWGQHEIILNSQSEDSGLEGPPQLDQPEHLEATEYDPEAEQSNEDAYVDVEVVLRKVAEKAIISPDRFPLFLYKRILRLHYGLPAEMRLMGDSYVRDEFRRHRDAAPQHVGPFINEWTSYCNLMSKQLSAQGIVKGFIGQDLKHESLDSFAEEQLRQLLDLKMEAEAHRQRIAAAKPGIKVEDVVPPIFPNRP